MVDGELGEGGALLLDEGDEILQNYFVEIALDGDRDGMGATDGTGINRFLHF